MIPIYLYVSLSIVPWWNQLHCGYWTIWWLFCCPRVILEIKGNIHPRYKRALFTINYKGTSDLTSPYVHCIFSLILIKQIFEKSKSLRIASKSQTQFLPRITPGVQRGQSYAMRRRSLFNFGCPPFGCITIKIPYGVDVLLQLTSLALHLFLLGWLNLNLILLSDQLRLA